MKEIELLYITRKFPPMVGGMENMSAALAKEFSKQVPTTIVSWGKSQKFLPYFFFYAFIKACYLIQTKQITHVHIGDALLSPLGVILKNLYGIKSSISVAGLDITFRFPGYQQIIPKCVAQFDHIICISNATLEECLKRGIAKTKCVVIPCGVYTEDWEGNMNREALRKILGQDVLQKKILITVGRLVKRKGVAWFIESVFPHLSKNTIYLIIGSGPEQKKIRSLIDSFHMQKRILLLGSIHDETLKIIYNSADLFVMPNIPVVGTMEGFGIVAVEASSTGLPIVAAECEGIKDAIIPNKTGVFVPCKDEKAFIHMINHTPRFDKEEVKMYTKKYYSWNAIGKSYINVIKN